MAKHTQRREPPPRHLMAALLAAHNSGIVGDELVDVARHLLDADAFADWFEGFQLSASATAASASSTE